MSACTAQVEHATSRVPLTAAFKKCQRMVGYLARRMYQPCTMIDLDDLEQQGYIGLIHAANTYDPSRGAQFATYAYLCIRHKILSYVEKYRAFVPYESARRWQRKGRFVPKMFHNSFTLTERTATPGIKDSIHHLKQTSRELLHQREAVLTDPYKPLTMPFECLPQWLPQRDKELLTLRYWGDYTYAEIGQQFNLSGERVRQLLDRALKRLDQGWKIKGVCAADVF